MLSPRNKHYRLYNLSYDINPSSCCKGDNCVLSKVGKTTNPDKASVIIIKALASWYLLQWQLVKVEDPDTKRNVEFNLALLTDLLAEFVVEYALLCCAGEARHAHSSLPDNIITRDNCKPCIDFFKGTHCGSGRTHGAISIYTKFKDAEHGAELCRHIFLDHNWGPYTSVGGPAWGYIALSIQKVLKASTLQEKIQALDYMFHLYHCGAAFFGARFDDTFYIPKSYVIRILNAKAKGSECCVNILKNIAFPELCLMDIPVTKCKAIAKLEKTSLGSVESQREYGSHSLPTKYDVIFNSKEAALDDRIESYVCATLIKPTQKQKCGYLTHSSRPEEQQQFQNEHKSKTSKEKNINNNCFCGRKAKPGGLYCEYKCLECHYHFDYAWSENSNLRAEGEKSHWEHYHTCPICVTYYEKARNTTPCDNYCAICETCVTKSSYMYDVGEHPKCHMCMLKITQHAICLFCKKGIVCSLDGKNSVCSKCYGEWDYNKDDKPYRKKIYTSSSTNTAILKKARKSSLMLMQKRISENTKNAMAKFNNQLEKTLS